MISVIPFLQYCYGSRLHSFTCSSLLPVTVVSLLPLLEDDDAVCSHSVLWWEEAFPPTFLGGILSFCSWWSTGGRSLRPLPCYDDDTCSHIDTVLPYHCDKIHCSVGLLLTLFCYKLRYGIFDDDTFIPVFCDPVRCSDLRKLLSTCFFVYYIPWSIPGSLWLIFVHSVYSDVFDDVRCDAMVFCVVRDYCSCILQYRWLVLSIILCGIQCWLLTMIEDKWYTIRYLTTVHSSDGIPELPMGWLMIILPSPVVLRWLFSSIPSFFALFGTLFYFWCICCWCSTVLPSCILCIWCMHYLLLSCCWPFYLHCSFYDEYCVCHSYDDTILWWAVHSSLMILFVLHLFHYYTGMVIPLFFYISVIVVYFSSPYTISDLWLIHCSICLFSADTTTITWYHHWLHSLRPDDIQVMTISAADTLPWWSKCLFYSVFCHWYLFVCSDMMTRSTFDAMSPICSDTVSCSVKNYNLFDAVFIL